MTLETPDADHALSALGDAVNNSRAHAEKSMRALREETIAYLNKRHDHNGEALSDYQNASGFADFVAAQEKWFANLNRDVYEASLNFSEMARKLLAEGFATAQKNSKLAADTAKNAVKATTDKAADAMHTAEHTVAETTDKTVEATHTAEHAVADTAGKVVDETRAAAE